MRVRRGGRKRQVPKGQTYGKPASQGINQLKNQRSHQAIAEVSFVAKGVLRSLLLCQKNLARVELIEIKMAMEILRLYTCIVGACGSPLQGSARA